MIILQLSCPGSEKGRVCSFGSVSTSVLYRPTEMMIIEEKKPVDKSDEVSPCWKQDVQSHKEVINARVGRACPTKRTDAFSTFCTGPARLCKQRTHT
jgi:hypothetical protein